jgi:chemotaxis protein CheY-P-specific phosphatase CheC
MSDRHRGNGDGEMERVRELATVGATWAAAAFAQLVGRPVETYAPSVHQRERLECAGPWNTGLFFEAEGDLSGVVAIFLSHGTRERVEGLLLGSAPPDPLAAASALRELGNIAVSRTVSAIADTLGARILISIPELVMDDAEATFASRIPARREGRAGWMIETELLGPRGELRALLVFAPDPEK